MFRIQSLVKTLARRRNRAYWRHVYESARLYEHGVDLEAFLGDPINILRIVQQEIAQRASEGWLEMSDPCMEPYHRGSYRPLLPKQEEAARRIMAEYRYQDEQSEREDRSRRGRLKVIDGGKN